LAAEDEVFYPAMAEGQLTVLQSYDTVEEIPLLYVLMDISLSMQEPMQSGRRHDWSRTLAIKLLSDAVSGEAQFFFRSFSASPHQLQAADSPDAALALIERLLCLGMAPDGTNIRAALQQAAADIREERLPNSRCEILLITDGEDSAVTEESLRGILRDDIQIHGVLIGSRSPAIEAVAKTYHPY
jgi:uncharacterized protein with von Willebrand factor type A (vWA) domain